MSANTLLQKLCQFTGSETFTRFGLSRDLATEGALCLANEAKAFWLLDLISSHQLTNSVKKEDFQVWTLKKTEGTGAVITATDGNDNVIAEQKLEYTDFPLDTIDLWAVTNEVGSKTIMLPSEY